MRAIAIAILLSTAAATGSLAQTNQAPPAAPPSPSGTVAPTGGTPAGPKAQINFKETSHDFGDIKQGEKVQHTFEFTNTGQSPLIISNVQTTCGCTASEWTKEPIGPGKTGQIKATFNSAGKIGRQNKVITIFTNAMNPEEHVSIVTNVLPADSNVPGQKTESLQPK